MNLFRKNVITRRGWFILPLILWAVVGLSAHRILAIPRHTASARIQILDSRDRFDPRSWFLDKNISLRDCNIKEYVESLRSLDLAQSVIASLKPDDVNELCMAIANSGGLAVASPQASLRGGIECDQSSVLDHVRRNLSVEPVSGCDMLDVSISVAAKHLATEVLNGYLRIFTSRNLEKRRMETLESANSLQEAADEVRKELKETEARILDFVVDNGFHASSASRLGQVFSLLNSRVGNTTAAIAPMSDSKAMREQDDVASFRKKLVHRLETDLERLESEQSGLGGSLGMNHPRMISLMGRINFIRSRIEYFHRTETGRDRQDIPTPPASSTRAKSLEEQYSDFLRELEYKNDYYGLVRKEAQQWRLKSKTISNNVLVVDAPRLVPARWYQDRWVQWGIIPVAISLVGFFRRQKMV